jgi:hypothetical protein
LLDVAVVTKKRKLSGPNEVSWIVTTRRFLAASATLDEVALVSET